MKYLKYLKFINLQLYYNNYKEDSIGISIYDFTVFKEQLRSYCDTAILINYDKSFTKDTSRN